MIYYLACNQSLTWSQRSDVIFYLSVQSKISYLIPDSRNRLFKSLVQVNQDGCADTWATDPKSRSTPLTSGCRIPPGCNVKLKLPSNIKQSNSVITL